MYVAQDSLSQRSKGVWRLSYHPVFDDGECGEREFATIRAKTKREAKKLAGELRAALEEELRKDAADKGPKCGITLAEWQRRYAEEEYAMGVIRRSTADSYVRAIKTCGSVADMDLADITEQDMKDCLAEMMKDGKVCRNTAVKCFRQARTALGRACDEGLIARNPARKIKTPQMDKTKPRSLDADERRKMDAIIRTTGDPLKTASALGLYMGLRGEEVCGLRWLNRRREAEVSFVTITDVVVMESGRPVLKKPKTDASNRRIPEPATIRGLLDARMEEQRRRCERYGVTFSEELFVLGDIDGKPLNPERLRRDFKAVCEAAGLDCTFHWLRHTFATRMIAQNVNPRTVAQWLGHTDPGFTLRTYCDADEGALIDSLRLAETIVN